MAKTAAGEFVVLAVGAPIMYVVNKRVHFDKVIEPQAHSSTSQKLA